MAQRQLRLQLRRGLLERLVLARVLDRDRRVRREHLERLDELERRELAVGGVEEVEHAHQLVVLVVQRDEQVVVAVPLVGAARPEIELGKVVELLLRPLVPAVVDEVGGADLVPLEEQLLPDVDRHRALEEHPVELGELADCGVDGEVAAGLAQVHAGLAEAERLAERRGDDVDDRVERQARLQLVRELDETAQQLYFATLGLTIPVPERHRLPRWPQPSRRVPTSLRPWGCPRHGGARLAYENSCRQGRGIA